MNLVSWPSRLTRNIYNIITNITWFIDNYYHFHLVHLIHLKWTYLIGVINNIFPMPNTLKYIIFPLKFHIIHMRVCIFLITEQFLCLCDFFRSIEISRIKSMHRLYNKSDIIWCIGWIYKCCKILIWCIEWIIKWWYQIAIPNEQF